jgi:protein O-mannosyl-transferase
MTQHGQAPDGSIKPAHLAALAVVFIATVCVYAQMHGHAFIYFDDNEYVFENPNVAGGLTWENFKWALTSTQLANWHPLTFWSHQLDCTLFGLNAGAHRLMSLAWHLGCAGLVFELFRRMTRSAWAAVFVAGVFALHPVNVECVAWVAQRKTLISTFFTLLALIAYLDYAKARSMKSYGMACLWLGLSLMAKPMAVSTPVLFLLLDYWPGVRLKGCVDPTSSAAYEPADPAKPVVIVESAEDIVPGMDWKALPGLVVEKLPMFLMVGLVAGVTLFAQRGAASGLGLVSLGHRAANACVSYGRYLVEAAWPVDLAVFYPLGAPVPAQVVGSVLMLAVVTWGVVRLSPRYPYLLTGWLWYVVTLLPVIGLVQVGGQSHADRYAYTPLLGIWLMAAMGLLALVGEHFAHGKKVLAAVAVVLLTAMGINTYAQTAFWADTRTLFERAYRVTEFNYMAAAQVGRTYMQEKDYNNAALALDQSLAINPKQADVWASLATCIIRLGRPDIALDKLQGPLEQFPNDPKLLYVSAQAYSMLAARLEEVGQHEEARKLFGEALAATGKIQPADGPTLQIRGLSLYWLGRDQEALEALEASEKLQPGNADTAKLREKIKGRMKP